MTNTKKMAKLLDDFLKKHNPCNIRPSASGHGVDCNGGHGCCHGCRHLGDGGCTVESLACKMWLCGEAWARLSFLAQIELWNLVCIWDGPLNFRFDGHGIDKMEAIGYSNHIGVILKNGEKYGGQEMVGSDFQGVKDKA